MKRKGPMDFCQSGQKGLLPQQIRNNIIQVRVRDTNLRSERQVQLQQLFGITF